MADRTRLELATSAVTGRSSKHKTLIDSVFASVFNFSSIVYTPLYMLNTLKYGHKKGTFPLSVFLVVNYVDGYKKLFTKVNR